MLEAYSCVRADCIKAKQLIAHLLPQCAVCAGAHGRTADSFTSIHDAPLHHTGGRGKGKDAAELAAPPDAVLQEIDQQELNRMFVRRYTQSPITYKHSLK